MLHYFTGMKNVYAFLNSFVSKERNQEKALKETKAEVSLHLPPRGCRVHYTSQYEGKDKH